MLSAPKSFPEGLFSNQKEKIPPQDGGGEKTGEKFKPSLASWSGFHARLHLPGALPGCAKGNAEHWQTLPSAGVGAQGPRLKLFSFFFPACDFLAVLRGHSKYVARHGDSLKHIKFTDKVSLGLLWRGREGGII